MTCKEKFMQRYPAQYLYEYCPSDFNWLPDPEYCCEKPGETECCRCWDREIPEEKDDNVEKIKKNTVYGEIKDSGDRTEFASGAVRDMHTGKGRMDLLPWAAIMEISKHCENGAIKYGEHNVDRGIPTSSLCDSAARHLAKYLDGWTDEPHLISSAWNLLWAIQMEVKNKDMVNTPWRIDYHKETTDE